MTEIKQTTATTHRVYVDGTLVGKVAQVSGKTFRAYRNHGQDGVDIRRVSDFRKFDTAAAWVAKGVVA